MLLDSDWQMKAIVKQTDILVSICNQLRHAQLTPKLISLQRHVVPVLVLRAQLSSYILRHSEVQCMRQG